MAVARPAARPAAEETSEREYQATLNRAVEDTEQEIFTEALGEDELDNDGDTSLEEMGDGLEGEVEEAEPEGEGDEDEGDEAEADDEEAETAEGDEAEEDEPAEDAPRDERGRQDERRIPPGRLREEANSRRAAEERAQTLERQLAELNGRFSELSARVNAPPPKPAQQQEAKPKPDMFADPEAYEKWVLEKAEASAEAKLEQRFQSFEQRQQAQSLQRVDTAFADAATGPRGFEFHAAYGALTSLNPRDPNAQRTVARIIHAADPEKAMWDWWEANGGPEYRERILEQLTPREVREQQRQGARPQGQPRHVIRSGRTLPSLNAATGSNRQQIADPEMNDGSEESVFRYGTRRG